MKMGTGGGMMRWMGTGRGLERGTGRAGER